MVTRGWREEPEPREGTRRTVSQKAEVRGLNVLKGQDAWKVAPQRSAGQGWQCSQESIGAQVREWAVSVDHTAGHQKRRAEVMRCSAKTSLKGP